MSTEWYSVRVEAHAPGGIREVASDESAADALMDLLAEHDGVVSSGAGSWSAAIGVRATSSTEAATFGGRFIQMMAERAGMPSWAAARTDAARQDVLDAENAHPTLPELVSVPEAAEILGVSPQRVHELAVGHRGFPEPVYELRTGRLWLRAAIEAFAQRWERRPGRPRKAAAGAG